MGSEDFHSSGDEALSYLSRDDGAAGDLVRGFPGRRVSEDGNWLEAWFRERIQKHFSGPIPESDTKMTFGPPPDQLGAIPLAPSVKLESVQAHYFRGFRDTMGRIDMSQNFIVIEGRNSSGKTSLAEALEWLFTGSLSRRDSSNAGHSRELEHCVTNQFRPDDDSTWVNAEFSVLSDDGHSEKYVLRRVLKEDYGMTASSTCSSTLFVDDEDMSPLAERLILDKLIASVPPLLMQHTLRDFVQGDPKHRREYFERLLRLDELTELIRQAVVTDDKATEFPSPNVSRYLHLWTDLGLILENELSKKTHHQVSQSDNEDASEQVAGTLYTISHAEFPSLLDGLSQNEQVLAALQGEQKRVRQNSFPLLARLRPRKQFSDYSQEAKGSPDVDALIQKIRDSWHGLRAYFDSTSTYR